MTDRNNAAPQLEHSHDAAAIRERLSEQIKPGYLRDWIYGGIDGAVTTFAIVAGAVGSLPVSDVVPDEGAMSPATGEFVAGIFHVLPGYFEDFFAMLRFE